MQTAVIFAGGVKQIVLTPENDDEKFALSLITADDDMEILVNEGSFGNECVKPLGANIGTCKADILGYTMKLTVK